ncbi:MAG: VWA domain-containing protein [Deltaproteobacteria bacterium]|nr:VWA domain-containing protein [Deltaproteobacteria bacterium]
MKTGIVLLLLCSLATACHSPRRSQAPTKATRPAASATTPPLELTQTTTTTTTAPSTPVPSTTTTVAAPGTIPPAPGDTGMTSVPLTTQEVKSLTNMALVIDASGSMGSAIESGTKLDYVKQVIKDLLVQPSPTGMRRAFGLRAFGSRSPAESNDCNDVVQIAKLGAVDPNKLGPALDGITPKGSSPIAHALQQLTEEFPDASTDADNVILLFADGSDTCNADPCVAAEQVHTGPKKVIVHVVGFDLDQAAEQQLRCVAQKTDGRFYLARTVAELRSSADEALHANLPYNLRIKAYAGSTPLPTQMTVYRSGTQQIVTEGRATGIKFFQLQPGSYDILVTYADSIETSKPSKMLKGVEVQASARAEQIVYFDLGTLELNGIDPNGQPAALTYNFLNARSNTAVGSAQGTGTPLSVLLTPGTYQINASGPEVNGIPLVATAERVVVAAGERAGHQFTFETGELLLRAETSQHQFISGHYQIALPEQPDTVLTEGDLPADGRLLLLPVGKYQIRVQATSPLYSGTAPLTLAAVAVATNDRSQELISFPVGTMKLLGKDGTGAPVETEFVVRRKGEASDLVREVSPSAPIELTLSPGRYQIVATRQKMPITPLPSLIWDDVEIVGDRHDIREASFQLGTLEIVGKDAKNNPLATEVSIYRPGSGEDPVTTQRSLSGGVSFQLTPGIYDIRARDVSQGGIVHPTVWIRGIPVTANGATQQLAKFIAGKVRLTCRGTNDIPIPCGFRLFTYGQDAPLYAGETSDQWQEFEMQPGYYYLEAGYQDGDRDQLLKKWINLAVAENQTVEQIIRF